MLTMGFALEARQFRRGGELALEEELLARGVAVIESLRAGLVPLREGAVAAEVAWPGDPGGERFGFSLELEATDIEDVCRIVVRGRALGVGRLHDLELETRIWSGGEPCR